MRSRSPASNSASRAPCERTWLAVATCPRVSFTPRRSGHRAGVQLVALHQRLREEFTSTSAPRPVVAVAEHGVGAWRVGAQVGLK